MNIRIPQLSLVVLMGPSGSGKSTFARRHFLPTEVISSDACRGMVSDNENDQEATGDAFELLHYLVGLRLKRGKLTVVDATNVRKEDRASLVRLAREHDVLPVAIAMKMPEELCHARNVDRPDRQFGRHVVRNHLIALRQSLRGLGREGFRYVYVVESPEEVEAATVDRQKLWTDRRDDAGPFDIIGDVHGCYEELVALLEKLDYEPSNPDRIVPPAGRKAIFLGDLVDRGPDSLGVLKLVMSMVGRSDALCVPGNHDVKLLRKLSGKNVQLTHGLAETIEQLSGLFPESRGQIAQFIDSLVSHYVLDGGRLVVAHAGMKEQYIGRASGRVREFALYGETTGETDEFGLPVRMNWAAEYRGRAAIVYGHTPTPEAEWLNNTVNIDTGCVFGGKLTALRWPEREFVSVAARQTYAEPARPFLADSTAAMGSSQHAHDDVLDLGDVTGKRVIETRLSRNVIVRAENAAAALEIMSRFAIDPKWLIYLPPTMSPCETSRREDLLEHPAEAFAYFRNNGVGQVVCQEKHMGSRAVVVVCRDEATAGSRFGVTGASTANAGIVYTRTGRRFFDDPCVEADLLVHVRDAFTRGGLWEEFNTDWFCLDCELMPWSAKAQDLLRNQYAAVGSAATASLAAAEELLVTAATRYAGDESINCLLERTRARRAMVGDYIAAYRRYCWPVHGVGDLKLAPFHLLASEGRVHTDKDHLWHMSVLARLADAAGEGPLMVTSHRTVDVTDPTSEAEAIAWWESLTAERGEGMVVKPIEWICRGPKGLVQPALKVRGREYLRIIYGPEYTAHLDQLRRRSVGPKRSLAVREFALGLEALERFVRREPLRRVHECVFGVLALESEPVDPRL